MRKKYLLNLVLIIFIFLFFGCVQTPQSTTISSTINPNSFIAHKSAYKAAVVFSPDIKDYVEHARPTLGIHQLPESDVQIGKSLCQALVRSAEAAYNNVLEANASPVAGQYDRIIKFSLSNSNLDVRFSGGQFFQPITERVDYSLTVAMEVYDGKSLRLLQKMAINGHGSGTQTIPFGDHSFKVYEKPIDNGIQQVADDAANILISGVAEARAK